MRGHLLVLLQNLDQPTSKPNVTMGDFEHALRFPNRFYKRKHLQRQDIQRPTNENAI